MTPETVQTSTRTEELILYIAQQSADDPSFGAQKLNTMLLMIDFLAYGLWKRPLTVFRYFRQPSGPVPDPTQFVSMRDRLIESGRARAASHTYLDVAQDRLTALVSSDLSGFSFEERRLIDDVIAGFRALNAAQLNDWTHQFRPWVNAKYGEELPFYTVFGMKKQPADRASIEWAESIVRDLQAARRDVWRCSRKCPIYFRF